MKIRIAILFIPALFLFQAATAQLLFTNPSFESSGAPKPHTAPDNWIGCFTPDGQPGSWGCDVLPSHGNSYVGLIFQPEGAPPLPGELFVSDWIEGVGQRFDLKKGLVYEFTIDLAHSNTYIDEKGNATLPGMLQIFGGPEVSVLNNRCGPNNTGQTLLWSSPPIDHTEWITYPVKFVPVEDYKYILFKIGKVTMPDMDANRAHVLMDNASPVRHNGPMEIRGIKDKTICQGECISLDGTEVEGGSWAYTYSWESVPAGFTSNQRDPGNVCPMIDTRYILTINDGQNSKKDTVEVQVKTAPVANAGADTTICPGTSVQLSASGGTSYKWFPVTGLDDPEKANPVASPLETTTYTVVVRNGTGCESVDKVEISLDSSPHAAFKFEKDSMDVQFYGTTENGAYQWLWDFGDRSVKSTERDPLHTYVNFNETFIITLTVWNRCGSDSITFPITIDGSGGSGNVGVEQEEMQIKPKAYPNPFDESVKIDYYLSEASKVALELYDIKGKLISIKQPASFELPGMHMLQLNKDLFNSIKGAYYVRLSIGSKTYVLPVVLQ